MQDEDGGPNVDINLCELLNIDVDKIALKIAMGIDPWADEDNEEEEEPEKVQAEDKTVNIVLNTEYCMQKTDMKHSTVSSSGSRKGSHCRSQSDMKLQENNSNLKTVDGLLEVPSEVDRKIGHHSRTQSQPIQIVNQSPSSEMDVINDKNKMILQEMMEPIEEFNINSLNLKKCKQ